MKIGIGKKIAASVFVLSLTACDGVMDGLYDTDDVVTVGSSVYIDASNMNNWYYIDLHALQALAAEGKEQQMSFPPYAIPTELTGEWDGESMMCTYWYDVFDKGLKNNEKRSSRQADTQPEPEHWDVAIHRNNVRTNGATVWETSLQDISKAGLDTPLEGAGVKDEWNETDVWVDMSQMFNGVIGNQRIKMNTLLSSWLTISLPPIPPAFTYNGNVFILRLNDGTYAALRLAEYRKNGTNCCMTIEYKYPLK